MRVFSVYWQKPGLARGIAVHWEVRWPATASAGFKESPLNEVKFVNRYFAGQHCLNLQKTRDLV